ncbi:DUF6359 domain-containing protein [Kallipyga massiliensis]|uniref:DUF6359 domain-containing protein n=1 Tax=Kallipyga massiliensis TaxID=1472764 RepID=UPI00056A5CA8|nr:DUF6359 domain-containing protein [Kallipyga massiliensis]
MNGSKVLKFSRRLLALFCAFALLLTSVDGRIYASDPAEKESSSVEEVANKSLSVVEAKKIENNKECTVEGYIVGSLKSGNLIDPSASQSPFNFALADARNEKNPDKIMPIYLADSDFMKILNVKDHPENLGKRIKLTGKRQPYFQQPGLILITAYEFVNDPAPDNSKKKVTFKYWEQTTMEDVEKGSKPTSVPAAKNPHKVTQSTWSTIVGWHVEGSNEKVDPAQTVINQDTVFVAETVNKDELRVINQSYFRSGMAQYTGLVNPEIYEGFAPRVLSALNSTTMTQAQVNALVQEFRDLQKKEILGNNIRIDLVDEDKKVIHDQATVEIRQGDKLIDTLEITNGSMTTQKKYPNGEYTLTETKAPAGYSFAQNESVTIDVSGALAYQQAPSVRLIHAGQTMATFSYENAPEGMKAPADMTPENGKVILPEPEASSDPAKSFLFWKDPAGNKYQPGAEVEVKETTNFVGVWGKNYWKIVLNLRYANGERITDQKIEDLGLAFKVVGSDGVAHDPWEIKSSLDTVTFFKDADGRYYFIRGDYKIIVDDSKSDYEVKEALFEEKPFDLKKDVISVPGQEALNDTWTQALEVRIQKKEVKATFSYENAPEGMKAPADMTPENGKVILPEPEASSDPAKSFLFWKDPAGNKYQPGAEVEVKETTNFVGVWGKNYWKIVLNLRYANGERITDKEIEDLGLAFKVVGSDGVAHDPWEIKSSLDTVTFFKDADGRYYFIRGDYKIIVDDSKSDYEVKEALFEEKPFDLKKDLISVPGKDSLTDTSSQVLEIRIQKKEVKATFSYENAPEGMEAPADMTPENGKVILPEPEASSDPAKSFLFWKDPAGNKYQPGAEVEVKETTNFVGVWGKNYWKIVLNLRYANGERITDKEIEDLGLAFKVVGSDGVAHDPWEIKSSLDTVTFFKDADGRYYFIRGDYKIIVDDSKSDYEVKEALFEEKPFDLEKDVISVPGQEALNDTWTQALEVRIQKKDLASIPVRVEVREDGKRVDSVSFQVQAKVNGVWTEVENPFSYNDNKQGEFENPLLEGEYRLKALGVPEGKKLVVQSSPNNMAKEITGLKDTFHLIVNEENKGSMSAIWAMFDLVPDGSDHGNDPSNPNNPGTDPGNSDNASTPGTDAGNMDNPGAEPGKVQPVNPETEDSKDPAKEPEAKPGEKESLPGKNRVEESAKGTKVENQSEIKKKSNSISPSTGDFAVFAFVGVGLLAGCALIIMKKKEEIRY